MGVCKSALEASVKYLARDLGSKGIRVNAKRGPYKTLAASAIGDAKFFISERKPFFLKRNVDIHDVGNSALYLLRIFRWCYRGNSLR